MKADRIKTGFVLTGAAITVAIILCYPRGLSGFIDDVAKVFQGKLPMIGGETTSACTPPKGVPRVGSLPACDRQ